jgi:hypothetical protein
MSWNGGEVLGMGLLSSSPKWCLPCLLLRVKLVDFHLSFIVLVH